MSDLIALAERCEKATGPDRELDRLIVLALGADVERIAGSAADGSQDGFVDRKGVLPKGFAYTASLDAAMTLVPEGWETAIYLGGERANVQMETQAMRDSWFDEGGGPIDGTAPTPALALCAAALRARASQGTGGLDS